MKFINTLPCLSLILILGGMNFNIPLHAENLTFSNELAQSNDNQKSKELEMKAVKFLNYFFKKDFEEARKIIAPELKNQVTQALLQKEWLNSVSQNGNFERILKTKTINTPGSDLVIVTIKFQNATNDWLVIFNNDKQIIGTDFPNSQPIEEIAIEFVNSLAIEKFDNARAYLHPFLKEDVFPEQVKSKWAKAQQENGDFKRIVDTTVRKGSSLDETDIVFVTIEFAKSTKEILFIFDSSKKITGVDILQD